MNQDDRLRRLFDNLDARPGFEERVMRRVAELASARPREDLRAQFERRSERLRQRLRREAWMNGITTLGIGATACALLWRYLSEVKQFVLQSSQLIDPKLLIGGTVAVVGVIAWGAIRRVRG